MNLATIMPLVTEYGYWILPPLSFLAQPLTALLSGVLMHLGFLKFVPAYVCVVGGAIVGDIMWYGIGYRFGESFSARFGKYFGITGEHVANVKDLFGRYHDRILIFSKITNGFGLAIVILFTAGLSRIPLTRYIVFNLIGEGIWTGILMGVGFFFSQLYMQVTDALGRVELIGFSILLLIAFLAFGRYLYKKIAS